MHSSLIQDISKIGSLRIPGTTTSQVFKNSNKTIQEITSRITSDAALETAVFVPGEGFYLFPKTRLIKRDRRRNNSGVRLQNSRNQILNWYNGVTKEIAKELDNLSTFPPPSVGWGVVLRVVMMLEL